MKLPRCGLGCRWGVSGTINIRYNFIPITAVCFHTIICRRYGYSAARGQIPSQARLSDKASLFRGMRDSSGEPIKSSLRVHNDGL